GQLTDTRINGYLKWHYDYDDNGNTTLIRNGETNAVTSFAYDQTDKLKSITSGSQKIEYGYSAPETLTNIKGTSKTTSFTQQFEFDGADRLKHWKRNGSAQGSYEYFPTGEPSQRRYINQVYTNYTYDNAQQMETLKVVRGSTVLLDEKIGYD